LNSAGQLIDRNPLALENVITSKMINSFEGQESAILKSLDKNIKKQVAKFRSQIQGKQVQKEKPAPRAEKRNSGRWKKDEEAALEDLVKKQNPHSADDWEKIARLLGTGRTSGACQSHWRVMNEQYYSKTDPTHFKNTLSHREVDLDPPGNGTEPWNTAYGVVVVVDGAQKRCLSTRLGIADFATRYFGKDISNDHRLFLGEPDAWADVGKQTIRLYERSRVFLLILCLHDTRNGKPLFTPTSSAKNDFKELLAANQDLMQARQEQKPEGIKKWVMKNIDSTPPCKPFHTYRQRLDFPTKAAWAAFVDAEKKQEQEEAKKRQLSPQKDSAQKTPKKKKPKKSKPPKEPTPESSPSQEKQLRVPDDLGGTSVQEPTAAQRDRAPPGTYRGDYSSSESSEPRSNSDDDFEGSSKKSNARYFTPPSKGNKMDQDDESSSQASSSVSSQSAVPPLIDAPLVDVTPPSQATTSPTSISTEADFLKQAQELCAKAAQADALKAKVDSLEDKVTGLEGQISNMNISTSDENEFATLKSFKEQFDEEMNVLKFMVGNPGVKDAAIVAQIKEFIKNMSPPEGMDVGD